MFLEGSRRLRYHGPYCSTRHYVSNVSMYVCMYACMPMFPNSSCGSHLSGNPMLHSPPSENVEVEDCFVVAQVPPGIAGASLERRCSTLQRRRRHVARLLHGKVATAHAKVERRERLFRAELLSLCCDHGGCGCSRILRRHHLPILGPLRDTAGWLSPESYKDLRVQHAIVTMTIVP